METNVQRVLTGTTDHKYLSFTLNVGTGYYEMINGELGFQKVPNELKLEKTHRPDIIKSEYIIWSRVINGKYPFFTGLLKTNFENLYFGDYYEIKNGVKKNSFILFWFSPDQVHLDIFFFNHFKLYPKRRGHFIRDFITNQKNNRSEYPTPVNVQTFLTGKSERNCKDTINGGRIVK